MQRLRSLIKHLQKIEEKYGNLPVYMDHDNGEGPYQVDPCYHLVFKEKDGPTEKFPDEPVVPERLEIQA